MGWQTESVVQLIAGNTIINPNGMFIYNGAPAAGNLIASVTQLSGTDQFGNVYQAGITSYTGPNTWINILNNVLSAKFASGQPQLGTFVESAAGQLVLSSGTVGGGDTQCSLELESATAAGGSSLLSCTAQAVLINGAASFSMPFSSAGITSVAQVVSALIDVGVFK